MKLSIGIVPVSHDTMKKTLQFNNIGFPIIEFSTLMANIYPQDDTYGKKNQPKDGRNQLPKMTGQHVRGLRTGHIL